VEKVNQLIDEEFPLVRASGNAYWLAEMLDGMTQMVLWVAGDFARAEEYALEGYALSQKIGNKLSTVMVTSSMSFLYTAKSDFERALALAQESVAVATEINYGYARGRALGALAFVTNMINEDYAQAKRYAEQGQSLSNHPEVVIQTLFPLVVTACGMNDVPLAKKLAYNTATHPTVQHRGGKIWILLFMVMVYGIDGQFERAAELYGLYLAIKFEGMVWDERSELFLRIRDKMQAALDAEGYQQALERGKTLDVTQAIADIIKDFETFA